MGSCIFVASCSAADAEGVCWFVIDGRSLIIFPDRQLGCSGTQLLPESSVLVLQTAHHGSPRMCAVSYFFCLACSANPARLFDPHTTSFSVCCLWWNEVSSLSLRPFDHSLCPFHLLSHPAVLSHGYSNSRLVVLWYKDLTSNSAIAGLHASSDCLSRASYSTVDDDPVRFEGWEVCSMYWGWCGFYLIFNFILVLVFCCPSLMQVRCWTRESRLTFFLLLSCPFHFL